MLLRDVGARGNATRKILRLHGLEAPDPCGRSRTVGEVTWLASSSCLLVVCIK